MTPDDRYPSALTRELRTQAQPRLRSRRADVMELTEEMELVGCGAN
jgi:hypothetical protein